ncbi:O-antigen/teichoic acid export membrane protein [Microbacterium marinum]|uniref:O-antigen/teichoic acid export membrane protein n=1 Tax=Microbacterium marinum TaxID=421115 RepID=A0A7W7BNZ5_9MICO|nr:hypothetical protein [Microbacterium marinum]MBB4666135.1 O-antigen/teichoic acid export membrane protein [Microbacterium marinum]
MTWAGRLGIVGLGQISMQLIGLCAGILVARLLSVDQYAYYALAIAFLTSINVTSESGLSSQVVAIASRRMPDRTGFGGLFALANRYRRRIALAFTAAGAPTLYILLTLNGADIATAASLVAVVVLTIFSAISVTLASSSLSLFYRFGPIQAAGIAASVGRLAGSALLIALSTVGALVPLMANWLSTLGQSVALRRSLSREVDLNDKRQRGDDALELRRAIARLLPVNLILVIQSQGVALFLGVVGATVVLAQVTAVSRYTLVFGFVSTILVSALAPGFARYRRSASRTLALYGALVGCATAVLAAALAVMQIAAPFLLGLLGDSYQGLQAEYAILNLGGAVGAVGAAATGFNLARGWIRGAWLMIPATIVWAVLAFTLADVTTAIGASILIATSYLPTLATATLQATLGLRRMGPGNDAAQMKS